MDTPNSTFSLHTNYTHQVAPTAMKAENRAFLLELEHDITVLHAWYLFPNTTIGLFPGARSVSLSQLLPITTGQTIRRTTYLEPKVATDPGTKERERMRAEWSTTVVSQEDKILCESVQKGMHQRGFGQGWYVTDPTNHDISEHAMRHFHSLYLTCLGAI